MNKNMQRVYFAGASQEKKKILILIMNISFFNHNYYVFRIFSTKRYLHLCIYCSRNSPIRFEKVDGGWLADGGIKPTIGEFDCSTEF